MDTRWTLDGHYDGHYDGHCKKPYIAHVRAEEEFNSLVVSCLAVRCALQEVCFFTVSVVVSVVVSIERPSSVHRMSIERLSAFQSCGAAASATAAAMVATAVTK